MSAFGGYSGDREIAIRLPLMTLNGHGVSIVGGRTMIPFRHIYRVPVASSCISCGPTTKKRSAFRPTVSKFQKRPFSERSWKSCATLRALQAHFGKRPVVREADTDRQSCFPELRMQPSLKLAGGPDISRRLFSRSLVRSRFPGMDICRQSYFLEPRKRIALSSRLG